MKDKKVSVSYWHKRTKTYSIEVKAWNDPYDGRWTWNVYAHIFDGHPMFNDDDYLLHLPMHGGVTFDAEKTTGPLGGIETKWDKQITTKVVGCDFMHLHDDYENHPSPVDYEFGVIPEPFLSEATYLAEKLEQLLGTPEQALIGANTVFKLQVLEDEDDDSSVST